MNSLSDLARFIYLNTIDSTSTNSGYINSIVISEDSLDNIKTVIKKLEIENRSEFIDLSNSSNNMDFLKNIQHYLSDEKIVFINVLTESLDPILFDQLSQYRENNNFSGILSNSTGSFPGSAKLFLVFNQDGNKSLPNFFYELSDRSIDIRSRSDDSKPTL